jgi:NAD+ synthase
MPQSQEEFYFSLPYEEMDLCLYGRNHAVASETVGGVLGLTGEQVERIYRDIENKRNTTRFLHMPAVLIDKMDEVFCDSD